MGVGCQLHVPAALSRERPGAHCTGGWVSPRTGLERCGKSRLHRDSIPGPVASGCADYAVVLIWTSEWNNGTMLLGFMWFTIVTDAEP